MQRSVAVLARGIFSKFFNSAPEKAEAVAGEPRIPLPAELAAILTEDFKVGDRVLAPYGTGIVFAVIGPDAAFGDLGKPFSVGFPDGSVDEYDACELRKIAMLSPNDHMHAHKLFLAYKAA